MPLATSFAHIFLASLLFTMGCVNGNSPFLPKHENPVCGPRQIENQYIVKYFGQKKINLYSLPLDELEKLKTDPSIEWVEPNYLIEHTLSNPLQPNINVSQKAKLIGAEYAWSKGIRGQGIRVAIIDSGIDYAHPLLRQNYLGGWNFLAGTPQVIDETGHGTHIAGIIAAAHSPDSSLTGIAPSARIISADFMSEGHGDEYHAIQAIEFSIQKGARLINNSWSNFCSHSLKMAFQRWENLNVIFINAAGNEGLNIDTLEIYPANMKLRNAVTVGSVNINGLRSAFSNYGENVSVYAPGEYVFSLAHSAFSRETLVPRSGTSMSTAFVTGALALAWSAFPQLKAPNLLLSLKRSLKLHHDREEPIIHVPTLLRQIGQDVDQGHLNDGGSASLTSLVDEMLSEATSAL